MKRRTLCNSLIFTAVCASFSLHAQAQVLTQTDQDLGHGFHLRESKQINVAGRWHSDKSFKFLYFGKRHVCQCANFSISPNGKFAIFQDSASLTISSFNANKNNINALSKLPSGKLIEVMWDKKDERKVEVSIDIQQGKTLEGIPEIKKTRLRLK